MAAKKVCLNCGDQFIGRSNASYCSPACKQRAHRGKGRNRNAETVTVSGDAPALASAPASGGKYSAEAMEVLAGLDAELASNARRLGRPLKWSTADETVRVLLAEAIDRKVGLQRLYGEVQDDVGKALRLSAELRLLEASIARLLKAIKTDMPVAATTKSQKAAHAAQVRWDR